MRLAHILGSVSVVLFSMAMLSFPVTAQTVPEIIDATGDGAGNTPSGPVGIAVDGSGNVFVAGYLSDNAFKITPGGIITEIIDATGDEDGKTVDDTSGMAVDG